MTDYATNNSKAGKIVTINKTDHSNSLPQKVNAPSQKIYFELNFKRGKFFPALSLGARRSLGRKILISTSLGLIGSSLSLKKPHFKKKART